MRCYYAVKFRRN